MWNCEPCSPLKFGPRVHTCYCFFFLSFFLFGSVLFCVACQCLHKSVCAWHCMFSFFNSANGTKWPIFYSLESGVVHDHQLLLDLIKVSSLRALIVLMPHHSLLLLSLSAYPRTARAAGATAAADTPTMKGGTVCAPWAHQIPTGPLWSTGGEFRQQPLVVPTQQTSFTKGLIKPDNIPAAWVLLFSQLNAKWQLKASPRRRY